MLFRSGEADGLISFGSTGAALVSGLFIAKRMENVERPALTITLPTNKDKMILLDIGANTDCTTDILKQFAIMGNIYAKETLNKENPKIALLNIGSENGKGTKILKETCPGYIFSHNRTNILNSYIFRTVYYNLIVDMH